MTDWEFYWDLVSHIASGVGLIITGWLVYYFVSPFLLKKRYTRFVGITYSSVMLIFDFCEPMVDSMFAFAAGVTMAFGVVYLIDKRNGKQKIFLAVTFYLLIWISWGVVILPWTLLYQLILMRSSMVDRYALSFGLYIVMELLYLIMEEVMMLLCIRMIHREYHCKRENMTKGELALMLASSLSLIAGYGSFRFATNAYETDTSRYLWNSHSEWHWILALYMLLAFAAMLTSIISYQRIKDRQRKEKEDAVLAGQVEDMKKHISEVEKLYRDIRALKHDMRNHVMILENLYGKDEETGEYIAQLKKQVNEVTHEVKSGNPVTDVILREKQKEAQDKGIAFQYEFQYPESTKVSAFDISIILSNAINNAIEAAKECENPYIHILSYRKNNVYMIEIGNSITAKIAMDEESGLPITSKKGEGHGFGLANIRNVAQRYYGNIAIEQSESEFMLAVMLMIV